MVGFNWMMNQTFTCKMLGNHQTSMEKNGLFRIHERNQMESKRLLFVAQVKKPVVVFWV